MKLGALAAAAQLNLPQGAETQVTGFAIDNRKVAPGTVFGAFQGLTVNGEDFIPAAITAGAVAVVARPEAKVEGAVHIADPVPRRAFARLAAEFFRPFPECVVAVTGTNGKTSTVEMTRQIWRMAGQRSASIGTLGVTTADESVSTGLTTPDIVTFLANMSGLAREGVTHVAFEASSHGLSQYRSEGPRVLAGAFANLSRDHLDYHKDMEDYFAAKMRLFDEVVEPDGAGVVWMDDEWSARAAAHVRARGLRLFGVGEAADGDGIRLLSRTPGQLGQVLEIEYAGRQRQLNLPLIGGYQAANALVSAGLALATGSDEAQVFDALSRLQPVRGRLERAAIARSGAPVYVDRSGQDVGVPKLSYSGVISYENSTTAGFSYVASIDYSYRGARSFPLLGPIYSIDSYWLVNANLIFRPDDSPWEFGLWGRNIFDEKYDETRNTFGAGGDNFAVPGAPATYGVRVGVRL